MNEKSNHEKDISNKLCPCSNKFLYRECHEKIDKILSDEISDEEKKQILDEFQDIKETIDKETENALCFVDGCNNNACKSHTVSKSSLNKIADTKNDAQGQQTKYVYKIDDNAFFWIKKHKGIIKLDSVIPGNASTFTGFCEEHEKMFNVFEQRDFKGTLEQCFMLSYRAFASEHYIKLICNKVEKKENPGVKINVYYDYIQKHKCYSNIHSYVVFLDKPLIIMASAATNSDKRKNNKGYLWDIVTVNSFATFQGGGAVVFSCLQNSDKGTLNYINKLKTLSSSEFLKVIIKFLFCYSTNIFLSPKWWDSLSIEIKDYLLLPIRAKATGRSHLIIGEKTWWWDEYSVYEEVLFQTPIVKSIREEYLLKINETDLNLSNWEILNRI